MDPRQLQAILPLLILAHLAGVAHGHGLAQQKGGAQPKPAPRPQPQRPQGSGVPQAQGGAGVGQGFHGNMAPVTGGLGSLMNTGGLYPHQQNPAPHPLAFLGGGGMR